MQKLLKECEQIYETEYLKNGDTMVATTSLLQTLQRELNIIEIQDSRVIHRFISNGTHVLFTKSVTYESQKTRRDAFDKTRVCTEIGNATRAVRTFFRHEQYHKCVVGLNLGNASHDMAVFIKKRTSCYDLVHFDPNKQSVSKAMNAFERSLAHNTTRRGYHPTDGNPEGICSYLAWKELLKFILMRKNPFTMKNLLEYKV